MQNNDYYIYKTTINDINSEYHNHFYIGRNRNTNKKSYFGSGKFIMKYIKDFGKQHLVKEILYVCPTKEEYKDKEKYYVSLYYDDPLCLNISKDGASSRPGSLNSMHGKSAMLGKYHSDKTKRKQSEARKKYIRERGFSKERNFKCGKSNRGGFWITNGVQSKIVKSELDIPVGFYRGKSFSKEYREKLSISARRIQQRRKVQ